MPTDLIFMEERQNKILAMLEDCNKLFVKDLCDQFSVSPATIRKDLQVLEEKGLLKRTHGGAIPCDKTNFEPTSVQKQYSHLPQKKRIAEYALDLIEDGDTLALDCGTTTYGLAELLLKKNNLTVVTMDIHIASVLENHPNLTVFLTGGLIRKGFSCTVGTYTNTVLSSLHVDKVFMATNSVTDDGFLCTPNMEQASVKQALIGIGQKTYLLCDSSKFGKHSFVRFGSITDMDLIITDTGISAGFAALMKDREVSLITV